MFLLNCQQIFELVRQHKRETDWTSAADRSAPAWVRGAVLALVIGKTQGHGGAQGLRSLVLRFIRTIQFNAPVLVFPAKEAVTQLASMNMVTIRLLPFLAIPAQAGTHASTHAPEFDRLCDLVPSDSSTPAALWVPACAGMA